MKKKSLSSKLYKTSLLREILRISVPILQNHNKIFINNTPIKKNSYSNYINYGEAEEVYAKHIFYSFRHLTSSVDKLEQSIIFFSIKKIPASYKKNGMTELEYYKYHIENHYIKIISIIDYTAKFIHDIFCIGIPTRKINAFLIFENKNTKNTKPAKTFKKFDAHFSENKKNRNVIIHQGNFTSSEIENLDASIPIPGIEGMVNKTTFDEIIEKRKIIEMKKIIARMNTENKAVINFLDEILEGLTPYFTQYYEMQQLNKTN